MFTFAFLALLVVLVVLAVVAVLASRRTRHVPLAYSTRMATVQSVTFVPAGVARATLAAMDNGMATGKCIVDNDGELIEAFFDADDIWASSVTVGGDLEVLFDEQHRIIEKCLDFFPQEERASRTVAF